MTPQDCASIITIVEAIGTLALGFVALLVSIIALRTQCQALRAQREALPVSLRFLVLKRKPSIDGQSDLMIVELKNTGVRAYLYDVFVADCQPRHLLKEQAVHVWFVTKGDSLPEDLDSMHKRQVQLSHGLFLSQYILPGQSLKLVLTGPPDLREIELTAVLSVKKRGKEGVRLLSSGQLPV